MAIVSADFLSGVNTLFRALWQSAFESASVQKLYPRICMQVNSTTLIESYNWLGSVPQMKLWVDEREHQGMFPFHYNLQSNHYEVTIDVDKDSFEDDQLGQIAPRIAQLGEEVPRFMEATAIAMLMNGAAASSLAYDGVSFYNSSHLTGVNGAQSNIYTATGTTLAAVQADFAGAKAQMIKVKDDQGRPLSVPPDFVVCPPELEQVFRQLLNASFIPSGSVGSMQNMFVGQADLGVSAYETTSTRWDLLTTQGSVRKPLILQMRKPAEFVGVIDPQNPQVFERRMHSYGVDSRFVFGYGAWEMACRVS